MDLMLLALTGASLIVALVFGVVAWRLARDERARSQARIAALQTAASEATPTSAAPTRASAARRDADELPAAWTFPTRVASLATSSRGRTQELALESEPSVDLSRPPHAAPNGAAIGDSFLRGTDPEAPADQRQRTLAVAAAALLVAIAGGSLWMLSGSRAGAAASRPEVAVPPLELISLNHERQGARLAVSGVVRNPVAGRPAERVSAVVSLFDQAGTLVASAQAQIDFLELAPGDESPFVIALDAPPTVVRYRVSFNADGSVVPHVDRRSQPAASPAPSDAARNVRLK